MRSNRARSLWTVSWNRRVPAPCNFGGHFFSDEKAAHWIKFPYVPRRWVTSGSRHFLRVLTPVAAVRGVNGTPVNWIFFHQRTLLECSRRVMQVDDFPVERNLIKSFKLSHFHATLSARKLNEWAREISYFRDKIKYANSLINSQNWENEWNANIFVAHSWFLFWLEQTLVVCSVTCCSIWSWTRPSNNPSSSER